MPPVRAKVACRVFRGSLVLIMVSEKDRCESENRNVLIGSVLRKMPAVAMQQAFSVIR